MPKSKRASGAKAVTPGTPKKKKRQRVDSGVTEVLQEETIIATSDKCRREIRKLQAPIPAQKVDISRDRLQIPKAAFVRLVREVTQEVCTSLELNSRVYWSGAALELLHLNAEAHLVDGFLSADLLRAHRAQSTLTPDDMRLAPYIASHGSTEPPAFVAERKRLERYIVERSIGLRNKAVVVYKKPFA
jgi:histone H3/H4